jgi:RNA polymerase primary sigma factor
LTQTIDALAQSLGREPTIEEIATAAKLKTQVVSHLLTLGREPLSLEGTIPGDFESICLGDTVKDESAEEAFEWIGASASLLDGLSGMERKVLSLRFGFDGEDPMTLKAIGEVIGRSSERIRQIESKALGKLRKRYLVMPGEIEQPGAS